MAASRRGRESKILATMENGALALAPNAAARVSSYRLAAIDIGSNSIHLIVVERESPLGFRILAREKDMVRLGESALTRGKLSRKAIETGLETLLRMTTLARWKGAVDVIAVATSAVREASNGALFLRRIREATGLEVRLLDGLEEARLIFRAVADAVDLGPGSAIVADVGGGSTEWCLARGGRLAEVASLPLGSLRLGARIENQPPSTRELADLRSHIRSFLGQVPVPENGPVRFIATSGTAACCADLVQLWRGRPSGHVRGATLRELAVEELAETVDRLARLRRKELADLPPVGKVRTRSIVAGGLLLLELARHARVERLAVSDRALREGLILEALGQSATAAPPSSATIRHRQVLALAQRVPGALDHAFQVARLSQRLFDLTAPLHDFGEREREWLEAAALLHDVGCSIHFEKHHKHSLYLILSSDLDAFAREEVEIIAHTARYHRGALPSAKHEGYRILEPWQRERIEVLAAIVRVANALDRTHAARVAELSATWSKKRHLRIEVFSPHEVDVEIRAADLRADLLRKCFDCRVEFRQGLRRPPRRSAA